MSHYLNRHEKFQEKTYQNLLACFFPGELAISTIAKFVFLYLDLLPFHSFSFSESVVTRPYYVVEGAVAFSCIVYFLLSGYTLWLFLFTSGEYLFSFLSAGEIDIRYSSQSLIDKNAIIFSLLYVLSVFYLSLLNIFYACQMHH